MEELKRPNSKATKAELGTYIDSLESMVKTTVEESEDLKTANEKLRKEKVVQSVEGGLTVHSKIGEIAKTLLEKLETASLELDKSKDDYKDVKEAVELKEKELKELFDIEKNAYTLSAIIAGQKKSKEDFESEKSMIIAVHEENLAELKCEITDIKNAEIKRAAEYKSELEKTRVREKEDYEYDFNRVKKERENALTDKLNGLIKIHEDKIAKDKLTIEGLRANLEEDRNEIDSRIDEYEKYKTAFETRESDKEVAVGEAVESAKKQVTKNYEIKIGYIERGAKKDLEMAENENKTLRETIERLEKEKDVLAAQVKESYDKLQGIALASVSSDQYKTAMAQMSNVTAPKGQA